MLWQLRDRAHQRLLAGEDSAPTQAPEVAPAEQATLLVANDADNSLLTQVLSLPLPQTPAPAPAPCWASCWTFTPPPTPPTRSPAALFYRPGLPAARNRQRLRPGRTQVSRHRIARPAPRLAVVNLTGAFAASHPSGLETETLTVLSICGTLHANLPRVTQVRFLVDGQPRATLAGHADLTRTYLAAEAVPTEGTHP